MRILSDVIDELIKFIPPKEIQLIEGLKRVQQSSQYAAPEMQYVFWNEAADCLLEAIPMISLCWHKKIQIIFNGSKTK